MRSINKEDYDFVSVVVENFEHNFYVKKKYRQFYKAKGFSTAGIIYFLINYGNKVGKLHVFGLRAILRDNIVVIDGKDYLDELTKEDINLAMGLSKYY